MLRQRRGTMIICLVLAALVGFGAGRPANAQEAKAKKAVPSKVKAKAVRTKQAVLPLNIYGFRIGMTAFQVKQLLRKKKVYSYDTGFSDLYAYSPSPGMEIRLQLTCSAKGYHLGKVTLTVPFTTEEADVAVPKFREKLIARYGAPVFTGPQDVDFCWGQCEQGEGGIKLTAATTAPQGNKRNLELTLGNDTLFQACSGLRPKRINAWLYQWIDTVQKFNIGMSLKDAELMYRKRYHNGLELEEQQDEASQQYTVKDYVAKDYDFFTALDYESQAFEGVDLGTIVLKFTGGQAGGKGAATNRKLYYASFSTTKFTDQHIYTDMQQKLDKFIKVYGKPLEVVPQPDGITARWQQTSQLRSVSIFDSGLITFEQADPSLKDAYREAAVKTIEEYNKTRLDRAIF